MPLSNMHGWSSGSNSTTSDNISANVKTCSTGVSSYSSGKSPYIIASTATVNTTATKPLSEADILIGGKSFRDWMSQVEKRLSILSPKPELLEKYEALQIAYDYYKTLEALLYEESSDN